MTFDPDKLRHQLANKSPAYYFTLLCHRVKKNTFLGIFELLKQMTVLTLTIPEKISCLWEQLKNTRHKHEMLLNGSIVFPMQAVTVVFFYSAEGNIAFINLMCSNFNKSPMVSSVPKCYVGNRRISLQDRIQQRGRFREEKNVQLIDPFEMTLCGEGCTN